MLTTRASVPPPAPTHTTSLPGLWALACDTALESLPSLEMAGHIMAHLMVLPAPVSQRLLTQLYFCYTQATVCPSATFVQFRKTHSLWVDAHMAPTHGLARV